MLGGCSSGIFSQLRARRQLFRSVAAHLGGRSLQDAPVVLCRVSRNFTSPKTVSIDARDHVVLKILAIDKDSYYNEFYLYQHLEKIGAWAVPLIVTDETDGGNGHTDTILKTMAIIMKKLEA